MPSPKAAFHYLSTKELQDKGVEKQMGGLCASVVCTCVLITAVTRDCRRKDKMRAHEAVNFYLEYLKLFFFQLI